MIQTCFTCENSRVVAMVKDVAQKHGIFRMNHALHREDGSYLQREYLHLVDK